MAPRRSSAGAQLTISRINRLLRPLRNKCASLASLSGSSSRPVITYSTRQSALIKVVDQPPLAPLMPPEALRTKMHFERDTLGNIELSSRIYAVRDCFKNIIQVVLAHDTCLDGERTVPSLAALCSGIIGRNIQPDVDDDAEERDNDINDELTETINELYEAVPLCYRKWTLVSHALSIILSTCPRHTTLINALLETCVSYDIPHETNTLLYELLSIAFTSSSPGSSSRVCHQAHSTYLVDLLSLWTGKNSASMSGRSTQTFTRIIINALLDSGSFDIWTCKAMSKLARELRRRDITCLVGISNTLLDALDSQGKEERAMSGRGKGKNKEDTKEDVTEHRVRLLKWMNSIFEHHFEEFISLQFSNSMPETDHQLQVTDLLLHSKTLRTCGYDDRLQDAFVCLATCMLCFSSKETYDSSQELQLLLQDMTPATSTYNAMVEQLFHAQSSLDAREWTRYIIRILEGLANVLRSRSLLRFEASLWSCALHYLESSSSFLPLPARGIENTAEVEALRIKLIENVDDAERRCFGFKELGSGSYEALRQDEESWEYEDMVGCWIRKSSPKRRKLDNASLERASKLAGSVSVSSVTNSSVSKSSSRSRSSSARPVSVAESITTIDDEDERQKSRSIYADENKENSVTLSPPLIKPTRRISNFGSILSDSLNNRTVLHPPGNSYKEFSYPFTPVRVKQNNPNYASSPLGVTTPVQASDDALDMFAYVDSSPIFQKP